MSKRKDQMHEDKALRDTARSLLSADISHVKNIMSGPSLGKRLAGRIGDGATDVLEKAGDQADNHRGILAALIGGIVLWFARNPILALLDDKPLDDSEQTTQKLTEDAADDEHMADSDTPAATHNTDPQTLPPT
ncbi:MAG: hypothetical protein ABJ239_12095 [Erythrobacter sp.]